MTESKFTKEKEKYLKRMAFNSRGSQVQAARKANRKERLRREAEARKELHAQIDKLGPTQFTFERDMGNGSSMGDIATMMALFAASGSVNPRRRRK